MVAIDTLARALTSVGTSAEYPDRNYWCTILYYYTCQTKDEIIMILDVQDLSFRYSKNAKPIFHNVNLQMEKGEILTILGANGAGKSTLLNCLANILEPYSGKILVNGASIHDMSLKSCTADWLCTRTMLRYMTIQ